MRGALTIIEIAMSVTLLASAGVLVRSFVALQHMTLGYDPHNLAAVGTFYRGAIDLEHRAAIRAEVLDQMRALTGVAGAAVGTLPSEGFMVASPIEVEDSGASRSAGVSEFTTTFVSADYFRVARIPFIAGRAQDSTIVGAAPSKDAVSVSGQVVINRSLARRLWPDGRAVGGRMRTTPNAAWSTVVGVVEDVRMPGLHGDLGALQIYALPLDRIPSSGILVRTNIPVESMIAALRRAIAAVDPAIVVGGVTTGDEYLRDSLAPPRFAMALLATFAVVALALSAIGLYGVIAYAVSQRTREIGIRVALGAAPRAVARLVVGDGLRLAGVGIALGVAGAAAASRGIQSMLYGVSASDPLTFAAVALLLGAIALLACAVPARRALRIDPTEALRAE
jgi:predicted permease